MLLYVGHTSDAIAGVLRKTGVMVHRRPFNTIRIKSVHPRGKVTKDKQAGVVYIIKCSDCDKEYID